MQQHADTSHIYNIGTLLCTITKSGGQGPLWSTCFICLCNTCMATTTKIPSHACSLQVWYQNATYTQYVAPVICYTCLCWSDYVITYHSVIYFNGGVCYFFVAHVHSYFFLIPQDIFIRPFTSCNGGCTSTEVRSSLWWYLHGYVYKQLLHSVAVTPGTYKCTTLIPMPYFPNCLLSIQHQHQGLYIWLFQHMLDLTHL